MDHRVETHLVPLAVDLDGTLIATDLLWEAIVAAAQSAIRSISSSCRSGLCRELMF